jgi:hypothetical protein
VFHQEIETTVEVEGVTRQVRISFDGQTTLETAEKLAAEALASYVKPTATLPYCSGVPDQESRWRILRESHPLPTPTEQIHMTVKREKERISVSFGDFMHAEDVLIAVDFPLVDTQRPGPCWTALES